jgi:hypothetical protein
MSSDGESAERQRPTPDARVTPLRGAAAVSVGRTFWLVAGALVLAVFAAALVLSFISVASNNARIDRMKSSGIPVNVSVTGCDGNLGGSGSNGAGYTCRGVYKVGDVTYHEDIGSMTTFAATGTVVRAVADPSHRGTVELSAALATSKASGGAYVRPGLLTLVFVVLTLLFTRVAQRSRSRPGAASGVEGSAIP